MKGDFKKTDQGWVLSEEVLDDLAAEKAEPQGE